MYCSGRSDLSHLSSNCYTALKGKSKAVQLGMKTTAGVRDAVAEIC